jgi:AcrR family transcriptional regulator
MYDNPMSDETKRQPGRPRDTQRKALVLASALAIVASEGIAGLTFESIAAHSGVGRPMLYRWWPTKAAILLEALLDVTANAAPYRDTGNVHDDLRTQATAYARFLKGPHGNAYRALFAEAQRDRETQRALREQLIEPRRELTRIALRRGIERNQLRADINIEAAIDQLYAPIIYRLLLGHAPLDTTNIKTLIAQTIHGLAPNERTTPGVLKTKGRR